PADHHHLHSFPIRRSSDLYTKRADYTYASLGPNYAHNVKKAKELLAAAGYPNGFDMELEWAEFQGWTFNEFVQLVARFFGDVGVDRKSTRLNSSHDQISYA